MAQAALHYPPRCENGPDRPKFLGKFAIFLRSRRSDPKLRHVRYTPEASCEHGRYRCQNSTSTPREDEKGLHGASTLNARHRPRERARFCSRPTDE